MDGIRGRDYFTPYHVPIKHVHVYATGWEVAGRKLRTGCMPMSSNKFVRDCSCIPFLPLSTCTIVTLSGGMARSIPRSPRSYTTAYTQSITASRLRLLHRSQQTAGYLCSFDSLTKLVNLPAAFLMFLAVPLVEIFFLARHTMRSCMLLHVRYVRGIRFQLDSMQPVS